MTAINTNVSALNAQYYLANTNKEMDQAMQRLSSGFKVNSAADDAAGLAIAGRMDAQTRGLTMAIKNANDAVSLAQTAEGALGEVTNMLQRIRELAVNSANSTLNDSDRLSLDNEVQALKAEIDRVGSTTTFNSQNLLDGSYSGKFQIGDKDGQTVDLKIASAMTSSLGMGGGSSGTNTLVSARHDFGAVDAGDIMINGQELGAIVSSDDMEDVLNNINTNVDNVTATGFNVITAATIGNGVTGGGGTDGSAGGESASTGLKITTTELGATAATVFTISASSSMDELIANINAETGGVVAASKNTEGKLVLSNNTGATITVEDDSSAAGSGFTSTAVAYKGFLKLESDDGSAIRIEAGNKGLASVGTVADIKKLGFRETFNTSANDGYTTKGAALTQTGVDTAIAKGDLKINGVEIFDENITTTDFAGKLAVINSFSDQTGVTASASFSKTFAIDPAKIVAEDKIEINGVEIRAGVEPDSDATPAVAAVRTIDQLVTNINAVTAETGIKATKNGNNVTLSGENVQALTIGYGDMSTTTLETTVNAASSIADTDRTITIDVDDVQEGARYNISSTGTGGEATALDVDYVITAADVAGGISTVASNIANALRAANADFYNTAAITVSGGVITIEGGVKDYSAETIEFKRDTTHQNIFGSAATTYASIQLDSTANTPIKIETGETNASTHEATHGFMEANVGASDFDVNEATLSAAGGTSMSGLSIATASGATAALSTLDTAIDSVNAIRGDLGAIQNRLSYTTNNLSSIVTNTEGAKGRIMDADFAVETSKLAKTQILSQAATSMLAQANQSKQGILALLQ